MNRLLILFSYLLTFALFNACDNVKEKHFLSDKNYRNEVHNQFLKRKELAVNRNEALFGVFNNDSLTLEQKEALEFLYAYMPLCDLADYSGDFFLKQVNAALMIRDYFPWGKTIPEAVFRHFVLVYRVNNENLDDARIHFFEELKDRVREMSMRQAALEVNHWCHEKVTYRGTDGRTSAPLALVKTSWGRCGEESTFTVTALRSVGIPARQCYTPRWAHTDDNHAWVEVWIDGKWHYMGACEPEPELDVAWFTAPAKRAMMVHTNVFGLYDGPEEKNEKTALFSKINLLPNYTETRILNVKVVDVNGLPVEDAQVKFKIYNYAQLYPIAAGKTDKEGVVSLLTGLGDLVVWANSGDTYGYRKAASDQHEIVVTLDCHSGNSYDETMELIPPTEQKINGIDPAKQQENTKRFAYEDSIRDAYMKTFMNRQQAQALSREIQLDETLVWKYIQLSQGNWKALETFMRRHHANPYLFPFLASLSEKDLRDTPSAFLDDHLNDQITNAIDPKYGNDKTFIANYILSPHIDRVLIRPWRSALSSGLDAAKMTATEIIGWIKENIRIVDGENYYNCPITPAGVYELRIADSYARNVLFVALCRTFGIPARLNPASNKPQYYENKQWIDASFQTIESEQNAKATVQFTNDATNPVKPQYEIHYTLAKFEHDDFYPLDYYGNPALSQFPATIQVDTGYYRVMTGSRADDGSVTISTAYFTLSPEETKKINIKLPHPEGKMKLLGSVDMNTVIQPEPGVKKTLKELSNDKGLVLCFIDPDKEPSKHTLHELSQLKSELESWDGGLLVMTPEDRYLKTQDGSSTYPLPAQTLRTIDQDRLLLNTVSNALQLNFQNNFPLVVFLSRNGGILFYTAGYQIGVGEKVLRVIQAQER